MPESRTRRIDVLSSIRKEREATVRIACLAAVFACVLPPSAVAQTSKEPPAPYLLEYSTVPMLRNAALAETLVRAIGRATRVAHARISLDRLPNQRDAAVP